MLQAFVAIAFKPLWLFLASLCGCCLQAFVAVSCKPLKLFLASLCGRCFQAFVAVSCKPLWLLLSSPCGCFLQAFVAVSQHPVRLFLASLCDCFLQTCLAVSCKPLWLFVPRSLLSFILFFGFGCSKFCFFCAYMCRPSFEAGWCHVLQILRPYKHLWQSLMKHIHCPLSDLQPQSKLHLCTQENISSPFTNDLHKVYRG